jgi:hypothetical protein
LEVQVYNINYGRNAEMVRRSETLEGYSKFIAKVRELEGTGDREGAMAAAVRWCIRHGVLKGFLEEHGTEVMNMLMAEWKLEDALVVEREEGREEGLERGLEQGLERGLEQGLERGLEQGLERGLERGREEGQNIVLELIRQGYSVEQIEARLAVGESSRTETAGK